jgi:prephenate dehydrogenase
VPEREAQIKMKQYDTVAIVGVGLIGGSIGLALGERNLATEVVGIGRRATSLKAAQSRGAVTRTTTDLEKGVADAELIVVCTPVAQIATDVLNVAKACPDGALITDAGSTKAEIVAAVNGKLKRGVRFVGSHPLAGSEKNGALHAMGDLFNGRVVVVTPTRKTASADLTAISDFWSALGATVLHMTPADHDRAMAATSHVPHLVASVLAAVTAPADQPLCATGWRDATRIAAGDPELWRQIFLANRTNVLKSLARFEKTLNSFRTAIEREDKSRLERLLSEAKQIRDALGN